MDMKGALEIISTTVVSDACDHIGLDCQWLTRHLQPTNRNRFWGYADTVQWSASRKGRDIRSSRGSTWDEVSGFISNISRGPQPKVYVAGCNVESDEFVLLGGLSLTYIEQSGYSGVVANGRIRDYEEVTSLKIPIWFSDYGIMDSQGCMIVSRIGTSSIVNGYQVNQGDLVFGDGNGVVSIPFELAPSVISRAIEIEEIEKDLIKKVRLGESLPKMIQGGGHI